ncbi:hypothetical protein COS77_03035 [Candidatus Roizmanbacteria bacterium CG06_land_8_20_14_3_00_34_14]|uniref:Plasmid stabilization protein n=2 Tax=Candidatus Roizmaniibacteriota TaxID=1752723 RepID=A0A2M7AU35_9BACT|nr:MAG: hypothetical protein COT02_03160 [Candidatus Roizmanbacteria bacterium CG07_land_8_20_14_0_80_34_15]PIU74132.1 MAG: hypothetical protein COS77_03035 [Candidatus Roizmanbacteria bacterium CG06_land_8_20_14_3_00_34_14]
MISFKVTKNFLKSKKKFVKNNSSRSENFIKTVTLFVENPTHPSLNLEKLSGSEIYTIRLSKGNRIFFTWKSKSTALFLDLGSHDKYRRY